MKRYRSPKARVLDGKDIGFPALDRLSTIFIKTAQGIVWHRHDETEVLCCIKGSAVYEFRRRPSVTLTAGSFLVIPAGLEHRLAGGIDGPCRRFSFFVREPPTSFKSFSPVTIRELRELLLQLHAKRLQRHSLPEAALNAVISLANLLEADRKPTAYERLTARSNALFALLACAGSHDCAKRKSTDLLMRQAMLWLEQHAATPVSMDLLVSHIGYSRSRFFNLFKAHSGITPVEWLTQFRISRARRMLTDTTSSIGEIAKGCGFTDPAFFARIFRRRIGCSPSDYRSQTRSRAK